MWRGWFAKKIHRLDERVVSMRKPWLVMFAVSVLCSSAVAQTAPRVVSGWSWAGVASSTLENQSRPAPTPAPKPGDPCRSCLGTGKVGDGRVWQICKDCDGTGKVVGVPVSASQQRAADLLLSPAPSPSDRPVIRSEPVTASPCPGGVCPVPSSRSPVYSPPQPTTVRRGWLFRR